MRKVEFFSDSQCIYYDIYNVSLHYLVKNILSKIAKF